MELNDNAEQFVQQLTENQTRLYGYVYSLLGDHSRAADVVQETNLVLWRKIAEFDPQKPFLAWAFGVARFQVLAHLRDQKRDRLLLDAELAESIGAEVERQSEHMESVRDALRRCTQQLTPANRTLIQQRYQNELPIADIAVELNRTVGAIKVALLKVRRQLSQCVEKRMAVEG